MCSHIHKASTNRGHRARGAALPLPVYHAVHTVPVEAQLGGAGAGPIILQLEAHRERGGGANRAVASRVIAAITAATAATARQAHGQGAVLYALLDAGGKGGRHTGAVEGGALEGPWTCTRGVCSCAGGERGRGRA